MMILRETSVRRAGVVEFFYAQLYTLLYQALCIIKVSSFLNYNPNFVFLPNYKKYCYGKRYKYFFM